MVKNIGFAITGSFCTHAKILEVISDLKFKGYNLIPIVSDKVFTTDTRFGTAKDFIEKLENICEKKVTTDISHAEPIGPKNLIDILVIAPCTGNTLSKIANAITDNAVTLVAKSLMRNNKPIVIGISSNDALGRNCENLGKIISGKNLFLVPFGQDNYKQKPNSLICDWDKIEDTLKCAINGEQLQPLIVTF